MSTCLPRNLYRFLVGLLLLLPGQAPAQIPAPPLAAWQARWEELETRESFSEDERLLAQTVLLEEVLGAAPMDPLLWERFTGLLDKWEGSSRIEAAREAYIHLLDSACQPVTGTEQALPDEAALRGYLQRALGLTRSSREEGRLLFYLAESWLRGRPSSATFDRRVEALLQQALGLLGEDLPADAGHFRLGQLHLDSGLARDQALGADRFEGTHFSRAVSHFQVVLELPSGRPFLKEQAQIALTELLQPELRFNMHHRFLPQSEIRLPLEFRNLEEVTVRMVGLPPEQALEAANLEALENRLVMGAPVPGQVRITETLSLRGRFPHDWRTEEIILGEALPAGWYGITLEGEGLRKSGLVLVTSLEMAALVREGGDLLVWVTDGESGQPIGGATVTALGENGSILTQRLTDPQGKVLLGAEAISGWEELHVSSGAHPGHLRRRDIPQEGSALPWLVVNPSLVAPGASLQWSLVGTGYADAAFFEPGPRFVLPDGQVLEGTAFEQGDGWAIGSLEIPADLVTTGPVYALYPDGRRLLVSHVHSAREYPLEMEFTGETLDAAAHLFLASKPVAIQLSPVFGRFEEVPDYIRFRISALDRKAVLPAAGKEALSDGRRLLHESILAFEGGEQGGLFIELPELAMGDEILPLHVVVLPLNGVVPLAEGYLGLSPFRKTIDLSVSRHLVQPLQTVEVTYQVESMEALAEGTLEGDLVVYRETWESRYIHRKRGTTLSEDAYLALPERSLLGAARTDYRLLEEGFIREEVTRLALNSAEGAGTVALSLDRPGYYNIEFDDRDLGTRGNYPDGPLEVWVIPDSLDLRTFRSEQPRLILEEGEDGFIQLLVLLDRANASVLIDLERENGSALTEISRPDTSAFYFAVGAMERSPLRACRVLVTGERRTHFLWKEGAPSPSPSWTLEHGPLFGLNPGSGFRWPLEVDGGDAGRPLLWSFFPDNEPALSEERLDWQRRLHRMGDQAFPPDSLYLSRWLPLANPFVAAANPAIAETPPPDFDRLNAGAFRSLFPEVRRGITPPPLIEAFHPVVPAAEPEGWAVSGQFPNGAGRWRLSLFSPSGEAGLMVRSWLVSTELPIRTRLAGPSQLRSGDTANLLLSLENTTRRAVDLDPRAALGRGLSLTQPLFTSLRLDPVEVTQLPVPVQARGQGTSTVELRLDSANSASEALHQLEIVAPRSGLGLVLEKVPAGQAASRVSLDITNWTSGEVWIASGLGAFLPKLWPVIRAPGEGAEPLLTALGDWALGQVQNHHGLALPGDSPPPSGQGLADLLRLHQAESGGWSWMPGMEADPWISALVVWAMEVFSGNDPDLLAMARASGRNYLEALLILEQVDPESRLFAMRALATPAFLLEDVRPSRIQARSFLEFFHRRHELPNAHLAMLLQVAKAYGFKDEVRLLTLEIRRRMERSPSMTGDLFWENTLLYLSLSDEEATEDLADSLLSSCFRSLSETGPRRSWEQVAGFMNLMAAYFWKGDFHIDGSVELSIGSGPATTLSLRPDAPGSGLLAWAVDAPLLEAGRVDLTFDTSSALSPVLIAGVGVRRPPALSLPELPTTVEWAREFFEETLMRGLRRRVRELGPDLPGLQAGDTLRVTLQVQIAEARPFAELSLPIPAGFALDNGDLAHVWKPADASEPADIGVWVDPVGPSSPLSRTVRLAPLGAGRHQFTLSYEALWAGDFIWPPFLLSTPRSGKTYQLKPAGRVQVLPAEGL